MSDRLAEAQAALEHARRDRLSAEPAPNAGARTGYPQPDLFSPPPETSEARTFPVEAAIERVHSHTSSDWKQRALECVRRATLAAGELTVEDIAWPDDLEPYDDRARGGVMRRAARAGWIASTKTYRTSDRPETHRRPLLVWQSRLRGDR